MDEVTAAADAPEEFIQESRMRGSNQSALRAHNKRAVLTLIRRHGRLAKADIARHTGLSPQTASVIMRTLEQEELVLRGKPRRGRVGQPSIPMRLNPDGAFGLGLKIGRRSVELVLMDFVGQIRARARQTYALPRLQPILDFVRGAHAQLVDSIGPEFGTRIAGLGVAMPFELWSWAEEIGAPAETMDEWRTVDVVAALQDVTGRSVHLANDATAACAAENVFGTSGSTDFVYFFVGAFAGGGIVMNGDLVQGRTGNAGALGSMPVPAADGGVDQLINFASLHVLEKMIEAEGGDPLGIWREDATWIRLGPVLDRWLEVAARGLAFAIVSVNAVYDFECAIIEGSFPPPVRERLVDATARAIARLKRQGLTPMGVRSGTIGSSAREIGSASLPFFAHYLLDHRVLLTEPG
ncbi:ROK family transcriptional regulator [Aurantimonas sp. VKM B-3413]|uniref:ROK family transcriptional regulator n=1 Tax=Aurantimonas sp. VKM B-3413 TaxID=2779401 RepID=UPI001E57D439|nr:ROK family transcriptional regulator [Aurantimonas sp. VKM B-3413]MCB8837042.1 ROK family transcriptional regulator [Aurantimonas sp. VKM B-3413]